MADPAEPACCAVAKKKTLLTSPPAWKPYRLEALSPVSNRVVREIREITRKGFIVCSAADTAASTTRIPRTEDRGQSREDLILLAFCGDQRNPVNPVITKGNQEHGGVLGSRRVDGPTAAA